MLEDRDKIADKFASETLIAQPALTDYQALAKVEMPVPVGRYPTSRYSLIELSPKTGRKHQLRRHMSHLRHPMIGDSTHGDLKQNRGAAQHFGANRLMLHASSLSLTHPVTGESLLIRAGLDSVWQNLMNQFGWQDLIPDVPRVEFVPEPSQDNRSE